MALVTVQRSPCRSSSIADCHLQATDEPDGFENKEEEDDDEGKERERGKKPEKKSCSECYFAVKGAAVVLPHDECLHVYGKAIANGATDIQQHLQSMFYLLSSDDILKMAVKLESIHPGRTRYLAVVSGTGKHEREESCLLGFDCNNQTTVGLVLPLRADTRITLDGDGGFSVSSSGRHHIFKPVSVQAMWSALQTLHKASSKAREYNYFKCSSTPQWIKYYEECIASDRSCLNEWYAMDDIESRRPPSPDTVRCQPTEREATEKHIRAKLKELMMSVDLDEVTSKYIRTRLEEILDMNLKEFKSFIDQEMLTILGQMDAPTEIFKYLYLGSEWNASNLEELKVNGIGHILNVTREIDNFFPGMFDYQNIRVYDDESTEILHYWDKTYRYIQRAKDQGSKVLVHCKMGISRSASVVVAYAMKAYNWNLQQALEFVKNKRNCIKPNSGFLKQLEIYQGILDASKHRHNSLWRSKSETNLKSSGKPKKAKSEQKKDGLPLKSESLKQLKVPGSNSRPKSWSPNDIVADMLFPPNGSLSSEALAKDEKVNRLFARQRNITDSFIVYRENKALKTNFDLPGTRVLFCDGYNCTETLKLDTSIPRVSSIKDRINELESHVILNAETKTVKTELKSPTSQNRSGLVLNLANQFESGSKPSSPIDEGLSLKLTLDEEVVEPVLSQTKPPAYNKHHAILVKPSMWPCDEKSIKLSFSGDRQDTLMKNDQSLLKCHVELDNLDNQSRMSTESKSQTNHILRNNEEFSCSCKKVLPEILSDNSTVIQSNTFSILEDNYTVLNTNGAVNMFSKPSQCLQDSLCEAALNVDNVSSEEPSNVQICSSISSTTYSDKGPFPRVSRLQVDGKTPSKTAVTDCQECVRMKMCVNLSVTSHHGTECPGRPISRLVHTCDTSAYDICDSQNVPFKSDFFYKKEDIPFTPGTVRRTKQQIEDKNLTRTTSFDSGFPVRAHSTPSTPPDSDTTAGKPVQRSHSLRYDRRPTSMFSGKWYPLPALASPMPKRSKSYMANMSHCSNPNRSKMMHSLSTPSVVEAVNKVICGTQEILNSAIKCLPSDKLCVPSRHLSSDSNFDFGSSSSLPDIEVTDIVFSCKSPDSECPGAGIVKQQCEILESNTSKQSAEEKSALESIKCKKDPGKVSVELNSCLVSNELSTKIDEGKDFGIVKRLTKELEAKAFTQATSSKEKRMFVCHDPCEMENKSDSKFKSMSTPSSPEMDTGQSASSSSEYSLGIHKNVRLRSSVSSCSENRLPHDMLQAPPTPHRKSSLDLNSLRKPNFPLMIKLSGQQLSNPNTDPTDISQRASSIRTFQTLAKSSCLQRTNHSLEYQNVDAVDCPKLTSNRPPPGLKPFSNSFEMPPPPPPPPPPLGPPRKMRKQHGSTHPLSKLTMRQRHMNPLYNTM